MPILAPMPLDAAVAQLDRKTPVASALSSAQWAQMPLALRERAFFTSTVENLRAVAEAQNKIRDALTLAGDGRMNRANFVSEMRQLLHAAPGDSDDLTDITSVRRLRLIYDHNMESAREYAAWTAGQEPALLDAYPAQELFRAEERENPRDWEKRWLDAGGKFYSGRMIALKGDPIWEKISRFGTPWPPFDFNSGMDIDDIDREEAEEIGLLNPGQTIAPTLQDFNAKLEASLPADVPDTALTAFKQIFGDQINIGADGKVAWVPDILDKTYDDAVAGKNLNSIVNLGKATQETINIAQRDLGIDLTGWSMQVRAQDVRHALIGHGEPDLIRPGTGETDLKQVPLTRDDLRAVPLVWRMPDQMVPRAGAASYTDTPPAGWPGSIRIQSNIAGKLWIVEYYADSKAKILALKTMWRKST
jgi:hypothetical protein